MSRDPAIQEAKCFLSHFMIVTLFWVEMHGRCNCVARAEQFCVFFQGSSCSHVENGMLSRVTSRRWILSIISAIVCRSRPASQPEVSTLDSRWYSLSYSLFSQIWLFQYSTSCLPSHTTSAPKVCLGFEDKECYHWSGKGDLTADAAFCAFGIAWSSRCFTTLRMLQRWQFPCTGRQVASTSTTVFVVSWMQLQEISSDLTHLHI